MSGVLRRGCGRFFHWCPACEDLHPLPYSWTFDGNMEKPTFSPSFKQTFTHWPNKDDVRNGQERVCHYFITEGFIQFCCDSWHGRSDIVQMPDLPRDAFSIETQD